LLLLWCGRSGAVIAETPDDMTVSKNAARGWCAVNHWML